MSLKRAIIEELDNNDGKAEFKRIRKEVILKHLSCFENKSKEERKTMFERTVNKLQVKKRISICDNVLQILPKEYHTISPALETVGEVQTTTTYDGHPFVKTAANQRERLREALPFLAENFKDWDRGLESGKLIDPEKRLKVLKYIYSTK